MSTITYNPITHCERSIKYTLYIVCNFYQFQQFPLSFQVLSACMFKGLLPVDNTNSCVAWRIRGVITSMKPFIRQANDLVLTGHPAVRNSNCQSTWFCQDYTRPHVARRVALSTLPLPYLQKGTALFVWFITLMKVKMYVKRLHWCCYPSGTSLLWNGRNGHKTRLFKKVISINTDFTKPYLKRYSKVWESSQGRIYRNHLLFQPLIISS